MTDPARRCISLFAALLMVAPLGAMAVVAPIAAATAAFSPFHSVTTTTSSNWAGYAVTGAKGSVSDVKGSWIVPSIHGICPTTKDLFSSFWVGIDGYSSSSVEQTGTDSDCQGGVAVYYAWYEFYPHPSRLIGALTISAGDTISAEVHFAAGNFTTTLHDVTTAKTFHKTVKLTADRSSAEWIAEAPSDFFGVLPLAKFGTVQFGVDHTNVTATNDATVSGTTGAIGSFSTIFRINMINHAGTKTRAATSALSTDLTSFTCTWKSAGP
jgi:Peptidase A4 family